MNERNSILVSQPSPLGKVPEGRIGCCLYENDMQKKGSACRTSAAAPTSLRSFVPSKGSGERYFLHCRQLITP